MSDEFDDLRTALGATPPAPDAKRRAENIALAQKNFADLQGSADQARPTSESTPKTGRWFSGVTAMFNTISTKAALTATTSVAALGLVAFIVLPQMGTGDLGLPIETRTQAEVDAATSGLVETEQLGNEMTEDPTVVYIDEPVVVEEAIVDQLMPSEAPAATPAPMVKRAASGLPSGDGRMGIVPPSADMATIPERPVMREEDTEEFANAATNPLKITTEEPVSTFSIDVDTASYGIMRDSVMNGYLPHADAVRVEELINYFPYEYPAPDAGEVPFKSTVSLVETPWNAHTQLLHIGIQGTLPAVETRPPLNLVFLIDTSGSMESPNKLPLLKQSFRLMLSQLSPNDQVAIVAYAGSAGQVLEPTSASETDVINAALNNLHAGGGTAGQAGLEQAYSIAQTMSEEGEVSRVILATDGDFNVGIHDPEELKTYIADKRDTGTYLSVLGFGRGNLDDATMQALAQNGNGQAAYIDTLAEAQKTLVDQLTGALFPIANDVKIQIEFNPANVAEYRLIGYETRALNREDFNNDKVDAGDIGAGHSVTAIYEITPTGSPAQLSDPLRYADDVVTATSDELAFLKLRYKEPGADTSQLITTPVTTEVTTANTETNFAIAMAGFGQILRDTTYLGNWSFEQAIDLANANRGTDEFGYRTEAVRLMRLAQSLDQ